MKKILSVLLSVILIVTATVPAFAVEEKYPFIYVHGMGAWGEGNPVENIVPNWSDADGNDIIPILNEMGYEVYNPAVGILSSAWDRACELYAALTGTVTDYGEAHSAAAGHDRYGRDYTGQAIMGEPWDMKSPINLLGHSFGGETVRMLASLLAHGDKSEREASGDDCSPLFKGGHGKAVHAVITLSSPHNGSQVANTIYDPVWPVVMIVGMMNILGAINRIVPVYEPLMEQWGISGEGMTFNPMNWLKIAQGTDNCGYELTLRGAAALNEKIEMNPYAYYYSYTSLCSGTPEFEGVEPDFSIFIFDLSCKDILGSEGEVIDGIEMKDGWIANDGIVPLISALYPFDDPHADFEKSKKIEKGVWYVMPTLMGTDHYDFSRGTDFEEGYLEFYINMMDMVNTNGGK
ncbi:MAG: hypothetical protein IJZ57_01255 [Clostridia bacterium]|nr:hypothetical protein [Clostridia bacterium]